MIHFYLCRRTGISQNSGKSNFVFGRTQIPGKSRDSSRTSQIERKKINFETFEKQLKAFPANLSRKLNDTFALRGKNVLHYVTRVKSNCSTGLIVVK